MPGSLSARFGRSPWEMLRMTSGPWGRPLVVGEAAVLYPTFLRLSAAMVLCKGDREVPGGTSMLFDRDGAPTSPAEDLADIGIGVARAPVSTGR